MLFAKMTVETRIKAKLHSMRDVARMHASFLRGSSIVVTEARNQITEKGHVVTGNLRREQQSETVQPLVVRVGAYTPYGYYVEILPDGGFLRPAVRLRISEVAEYVARDMLEGTS